MPIWRDEDGLHIKVGRLCVQVLPCGRPLPPLTLGEPGPWEQAVRGVTTEEWRLRVEKVSGELRKDKEP